MADRRRMDPDAAGHDPAVWRLVLSFVVSAPNSRAELIEAR
jgi:hypothetical protein